MPLGHQKHQKTENPIKSIKHETPIGHQKQLKTINPKKYIKHITPKQHQKQQQKHKMSLRQQKWQ